MATESTPALPAAAALTCAWCGIPVHRRPSKIAAATTGQFYCTPEHQNLARQTRQTHPCGYCGIPVERKTSSGNRSKSGMIFCSRAHQGLAFRSDSTINITSGPARTRSHTVPASAACADCGQKRQPHLLTDGRCSRCTWAHERVTRWLTGDLTVTYCGRAKDPASWVKRYLIATRGDRCEECREEVRRPDGISVIQLNHIDGDYWNNNLDNLELLCPNHHAMTDTWGSRNKQVGRRRRVAEAKHATANSSNLT
jgi:hypothetical protein